MKKQILASLLILSSAFAPAMEERAYQLMYESFSSLSPYFPAEPSASQMPDEAALISDLRKDISNFENQLKLFEWADIGTEAMYLFSTRDEHRDPVKFLQYCYYQKSHENIFIPRWNLQGRPTLLNNYQNAQIDGYSALSAAMLAEDISDDAKRNFIQELINLDFKPTAADITLAQYLYSGLTIEDKKTFMHLLHTHPTTNWYVLPPEVRKYIAQLVIQLFQKTDVWLLPEKQDPSTWDQPEVSTSEIPSVFSS